ncbi:MAG: hypothetical protein ABEK59_07165 [Halobacteria archaeon]
MKRELLVLLTVLLMVTAGCMDGGGGDSKAGGDDVAGDGPGNVSTQNNGSDDNVSIERVKPPGGEDKGREFERNLTDLAAKFDASAVYRNDTERMESVLRVDEEDRSYEFTVNVTVDVSDSGKSEDRFEKVLHGLCRGFQRVINDKGGSEVTGKFTEAGSGKTVNGSKIDSIITTYAPVDVRISYSTEEEGLFGECEVTPDDVILNIDGFSDGKGNVSDGSA